MVKKEANCCSIIGKSMPVYGMSYIFVVDTNGATN